mmetsp:Transcript_63569/g.187654  ORF Transcript_63569/g.187654 Transcript_63569/m.187654 type:complete len:80 (-) Transcript_63569:966-1205(-)
MHHKPKLALAIDNHSSVATPVFAALPSDVNERIMNQKKLTIATKAMRRCSGTTVNVRVWTGIQRAQYFASSPFSLTSSA